MKIKRKKKNRISAEGFSFVEVIIATSILLLVFSGLISTFNFVVKSSSRTVPIVQATFLAEEGIEAVMTIRDYGWTSEIAPLETGGDLYLEWNGSRFVATSTPEVIDGKFKRSFVLEDVFRDGNDNISESGTLDNGARKVTVTVDWGDESVSGDEEKKRVVTTYIMNIFND